MNSLARFQPRVLGIVRILFALLFLEHGLQKLLGWFGGVPGELTSLLLAAGIVETVGGLLLILGLLTRPLAVILTLEMAFAYATVHLPQGPWPIQNLGELALLYGLFFLYLIFAGPGDFSLDGLLGKERVPGSGLGELKPYSR